MQVRANFASPGKHERFERFQFFLTLVDELLDFLHLALADAVHSFLKKIRRGSQLAPQVEQLILDLAQYHIQEPVGLADIDFLVVESPRQTDDGVQLVDGPVGLDALRVFRDALAADQSGLALVARARVDAGNSNRHFKDFFDVSSAKIFAAACYLLFNRFCQIR